MSDIDNIPNASEDVINKDINNVTERSDDDFLRSNNDSSKDTAPSSDKNKKTTFAKGLIEQIELIVAAFAIIILVFTFVGRTCEVRGTSMEDTLYDKEMVLISNLFYTPERGDVVVFHQTGDKYNEPIVKRVIGLPGDTVKIEYLQTTSKMKVTVTSADGVSTVLDEDYIKYSSPRYYTDEETYVKEGTVFVMGDNRSNSADSRDSNIGLVDTRRILGKVILRISPFSRFGTIN